MAEEIGFGEGVVGRLYRVTLYYNVDVNAGRGVRRARRRDELAVVAQHEQAAIARAALFVHQSQHLRRPEVVMSGDYAPTATLDARGIAVLS